MEIKLSASQIKMFCASKAKWFGKYVAWIEDEYTGDALTVWVLIEDYLLNPFHDFEKIVKEKWCEDIEKVKADYDVAVRNAEAVKNEIQIWEVQKYVEWELNGVKILGYIDDYKDWIIYELKTAQYLTDPNKEWAANFWSWMSTIDEYRLQCWIYMRLLWVDTAKIVEVSKYGYKDKRHASQIIEIKNTPEFNKSMEDKFFPIIKEMSDYYKKYNWIRELPWINERDDVLDSIDL